MHEILGLDLRPHHERVADGNADRRGAVEDGRRFRVGGDFVEGVPEPELRAINHLAVHPLIADAAHDLARLEASELRAGAGLEVAAITREAEGIFPAVPLRSRSAVANAERLAHPHIVVDRTARARRNVDARLLDQALDLVFDEIALRLGRTWRKGGDEDNDGAEVSHSHAS